MLNFGVFLTSLFTSLGTFFHRTRWKKKKRFRIKSKFRHMPTVLSNNFKIMSPNFEIIRRNLQIIISRNFDLIRSTFFTWPLTATVLTWPSSMSENDMKITEEPLGKSFLRTSCNIIMLPQFAAKFDGSQSGPYRPRGGGGRWEVSGGRYRVHGE